MPIHDWTRVPAGIFHDFHHEWISTTKRALNSGLLPPDYYALAEQTAGGLGPDVLTLEGIPPGTARDVGAGPAPSGTARGGIAMAANPPRVRYTATAEPERYARKRKRVVIRHSSDDRVVAVVEIISPGNKASRSALRTFVGKAVELLEAGIHLLLADLFPPGSRDPQGIHAAIWSEIGEDTFQLPADSPSPWWPTRPARSGPRLSSRSRSVMPSRKCPCSWTRRLTSRLPWRPLTRRPGRRCRSAGSGCPKDRRPDT